MWALPFCWQTERISHGSQVRSLRISKDKSPAQGHAAGFFPRSKSQALHGLTPASSTSSLVCEISGTHSRAPSGLLALPTRHLSSSYPQSQRRGFSPVRECFTTSKGGTQPPPGVLLTWPLLGTEALDCVRARAGRVTEEASRCCEP